jgi:hypothetical protein
MLALPIHDGGQMFSIILKLVLIVLGAIFGLVIATIVWVVFLGIGMPKGSAVDIGLLLRSPLYWLTLVAVLVLFSWLARRWVFS